MKSLNKSFTFSGFLFANRCLHMRNAFMMMLAVSLFSSCSSSFTKNIFSHKTPHEAYADRLDDKGLDKTPQGKQWIAASRAALEHPVEVELPNKVQVYYRSEKPGALGLEFSARQGEKLNFVINKRSPFVLYADLFRRGTNEYPLLSVDTANSTFSFDVDETADYVLRLQPELFKAADYTLSIAVGPSLDFPVSGASAKPGSYWGDDRDAGKRRHEGVDIFAPRRTPVVAAADGTITAVREGGLGGKTVWLTPEGKPYSLYYAHLDEQLVHEGQSVKKGAVLGLVGNTGNAKNTASHLHFGVYTFHGAVDPLPFIDRSVKKAPSLTEKDLKSNLRLKKSLTGVNGLLVPTNTILQPVALTSKGYIAELPDGQLIEVSPNAVEPVVSKRPKVIAAEGSKRTSRR